MNYSIFRFTLNMHNHRSQVSVPAFMGDTGIRLLISLTDGGNPYFIKGGCIAVLSGTKPNGDKLYNRCLLENPIEKDGEIHYTRIVYDFTEQTSNCKGVTNCEIILYGTDGHIITAPKFVIVVDEREVGYDDIIESETEKNALDLAMTAEAQRESAESLRVSAETLRASAESTRESSELTRLTAEAERVSAEEARVLAEAERVRAEEGRANPPKLYRHSIVVTYEKSDGTVSYEAHGVIYNTSPELLAKNDIKDYIMTFTLKHVTVDGYKRIPLYIGYANAKYGFYAHYVTATSVDANGMLYLTEASKNSVSPTITDTVTEV